MGERLTVAELASFIAPIRAAQVARREGYCEVAADVRILDDLCIVAEAARAAGPFPATFINPYQCEVCQHCEAEGHGWGADTITHREDCSGIALRDSLARLEAPDGT